MQHRNSVVNETSHRKSQLQSGRQNQQSSMQQTFYNTRHPSLNKHGASQLRTQKTLPPYQPQ